MNEQSQNLLSNLNSFFITFFLWIGLLVLIVLIVLLIASLIKNQRRENYVLNFVTLLVKLPKGNEIKIDAAEQMFAGLYSLKKEGFFSFLKPEDTISFEIVGMKEDIAFYVTCHKAIRDFVEKQVNGAYPLAEISEMDEVNIFNEKGRVAFAPIKLEKANFYPIKTYKDLPTDGLSLITSAMSKMSDGEGATLQILMRPEGKRWQTSGQKYNQKEKKRESDPDKANYTHDPKEVEAVNNKVGKSGFRVSIRAVVSAQNATTAQSNLNNIVGAFSQFSSTYNKFKKPNFLLFKHLFMIDFIYRYMRS